MEFISYRLFMERVCLDSLSVRDERAYEWGYVISKGINGTNIVQRNPATPLPLTHFPSGGGENGSGKSVFVATLHYFTFKPFRHYFLSMLKQKEKILLFVV